MPRRMQVRWVERLKMLQALMPDKGTTAHALLEVGWTLCRVAGAIVDGVWCAIAPPDRRPGDSWYQKRGG